MLELVLADGNRVQGACSLGVCDVSDAPIELRSPGTMKGVDDSQYFYLNESRRYEVRRRRDNSVVRRIGFSISPQLAESGNSDSNSRQYFSHGCAPVKITT